jgi:carboxypeptidase C (cathepsin A)
MDHDPVLQGLTAPLTSALVAYVRDDLGYESDQPYQLLNRKVSQAWQWQRDDQGYLGVADDLKAAMSLNRHLQALIAHGYHDLVTSYFASRYVVDQMALDAAIRPNLTLATYNGGHMFYTRPQARTRLAEDARAFYRKATNAGADEADALEPARPSGRVKSAAERDLPSLAPSTGASVRHLSRDDP